MDTKDTIKNIIFKSVDEVNQQLLKEQQVEKAIATPLIGSDSKLDSLALLNLIVAAEDKVITKFGVSLTLVDERAFSQEESPFRTIGSFIDYVILLLKEEGIE